MVDQVAVLSDVHGVLPAVEAVLAEPDVGAADLIVLTGDIAAGPQPARTLDLLLSLGERVRWVHGNCERELVDIARGSDAALPDQISGWAAAQLRTEHVELLDGLPRSITLDVRGLGEVLFCHATPRDDEEFVLVDSSLDRWAEVSRAHRTPSCADTPTCRSSGSWTGVRSSTPAASECLTARRVRTGPCSVARTARRSSCAAPTTTARPPPTRSRPTATIPDIADWTQFFIREPVSDTEALATFAPEDGRHGAPTGPSGKTSAT